jgi:Flp pilus assembly pilin Flp
MRVRRRRDQEGAAAVEFALVLPVLLLVVFGIIEMAFLMKDNVAVASASRVGARIASAAPNLGPADCDVDSDIGVPCSPDTTPRFAQLAADAMQTNGGALPTDQIDEIWIYNANDAGFPNAARSFENVECTTQCVKFVWSEKQKAFRYGGGDWREVATNVCATEGARVGVRMMTTHPWVTGFELWPGIPKTLPVDDHSVMSFEPLTIADQCA